MPGSNAHSEAQLTGRQRRRLRLARESGYLIATCPQPQRLLAAYARWCWRLRLPVVWCERLSPRSRYGRMHLDLYTTPHRLTADGQADLQALAPRAATSPHDAHWDHVPLRELDGLASAVLRTVTRSANIMPNRPASPAFAAGPSAKVLLFDPSLAVSA